MQVFQVVVLNITGSSELAQHQLVELWINGKQKTFIYSNEYGLLMIEAQYGIKMMDQIELRISGDVTYEDKTFGFILSDPTQVQ